MISTGDMRKGVVVEIDGALFTVLDYQHIKVGRGSAQVRIKVRNVRTGATSEKTFQAGEKFTRARLENRKVQYLYKEDDNYYMMDQQTYDQFALTPQQLGDTVHYLKENGELDVQFYGDEAVGVELPITLEFEVVETDPGFKGDTASGGSKPAKLDTGLVIQVPLFVNTGDRIKVDTRTGTYLERI
ncbi:MAG: elongation factor P [Chloroflexota bacterium]